MPDMGNAAWIITQQTESQDIGPSGTFVAGVKVTFRTARGVTASVFVPADSYSAENVRAAVAEKAATVDAVADLRG